MNQIALKKAVMDALEEMFSNGEIPASEMRSDLESIKEEIDSMIESIADED